MTIVVGDGGEEEEGAHGVGVLVGLHGVLEVRGDLVRPSSLRFSACCLSQGNQGPD